MDILTLGTLSIDSIQTRSIFKKEVLGGSGAYFSLAASIFSNVFLVSAIGLDFPTIYLDLLRSHGIDVSGVCTLNGKSSRWRAVYNDNYELKESNLTESGPYPNFSPRIPKETAFKRILFLGASHPRIQIELLKHASGCKFIACDSAAVWIRTEWSQLDEVFSRSNMVFLNQYEATLFSDKGNLRESVNKILSLGPEFIIIKMGNQGSILFTSQNETYVQAYRTQDLEDPTGAGDSFAGGVIGHLSHVECFSEESVREAMAYGASVASYAVEGVGVEGLEHLTIDQVKERMSRIG